MHQGKHYNCISHQIIDKYDENNRENIVAEIHGDIISILVTVQFT